MKKLFILAIAITSSLLFVQCKKTETLVPQEEIISTVKTLAPDALNGTSWEVLSIDSDPNAVEITWTSRFPKLTFNNGILEMKLGLDFCTKEYLTNDDKVVLTTISSCPISNPNHVQLYNLFEGEYRFRGSSEDQDILYVRSINGTILTLRKINSLIVTAPVNGLIVE
jgi:hypothetical protein